MGPPGEEEDFCWLSIPGICVPKKGKTATDGSLSKNEEEAVSA